MGLSHEEIDRLIEKLREKYDNYASTHDPRWFNRTLFEERLLVAMKNKMNLEGFILAEISNFEKIVEKYDKKKKPKTFTKEVERIIEENEARIKKYPPIEFHPRCGMEIARCYGALNELAQYYFPVLPALMTDSILKNKSFHLEERLHFLGMPRGNKQSKRIEDHELVLSRKNVDEIEIERDKNDYLKETAFLLHDLIDFCSRLLEMRNPEWETPLQIQNLHLDESRMKKALEFLRDLTGYGAILKIQEYAQRMIDDFRLTAFKKKPQ